MAELLEYALDTEVPDVFVRRLLNSRDHWDEEFMRRLDELAYEFRPTWQSGTWMSIRRADCSN